MTTDPVEAEATGQTHLVAIYKGHEFKIPVDADNWPLGLISHSITPTADGGYTANATAVALALQGLLGSQWVDFLRAFPLARELVPASRAFAAAIGFEGDARDLSFGALPRLLATLISYRDAVEATLASMGLSYGDRWRFDADGRRILTLRQIHVRLTYALPNSPLGIACNNGRMPYTATDLLLMDVFEAVTGFQMTHPSRPLTPQQLAARKAQDAKKDKERAAADDYRKRSADAKNRRQKALDIALTNAQPGRHAHARTEEKAD